MLSEFHDEMPSLPCTGLRWRASWAIFSGREMSRLHRIPDTAKTMKTDSRRFRELLSSLHVFLIHPPDIRTGRALYAIVSYVSSARAPSLFWSGSTDSPTARIPIPLSPNPFLHHPGITRLLLPRPCLVPVIGDRWGIDARVKRAGSSPALLAARKTHGGGYRIGVAGNRPCPRVASGAKRPPRVLNQRRCTNGRSISDLNHCRKIQWRISANRADIDLRRHRDLCSFFPFFFFKQAIVQSRLNPVGIWDEFVERNGKKYIKSTEPN